MHAAGSPTAGPPARLGVARREDLRQAYEDGRHHGHLPPAAAQTADRVDDLTQDGVGPRRAHSGPAPRRGAPPRREAASQQLTRARAEFIRSLSATDSAQLVSLLREANRLLLEQKEFLVDVNRGTDPTRIPDQCQHLQAEIAQSTDHLREFYDRFVTEHPEVANLRKAPEKSDQEIVRDLRRIGITPDKVGEGAFRKLVQLEQSVDGLKKLIQVLDDAQDQRREVARHHRDRVRHDQDGGAGRAPPAARHHYHAARPPPLQSRTGVDSRSDSDDDSNAGSGVVGGGHHSNPPLRSATHPPSPQYHAAHAAGQAWGKSDDGWES